MPKKKVAKTEAVQKQPSSQEPSWTYRTEFFDMKQNENESCDEWYVRLKSVATNCKFENLVDEFLKNKFVTGMQKGSVLNRLLMEDTTKTSEQLLSIANTKELAMKFDEIDVNKLQRTENEMPKKPLRQHRAVHLTEKHFKCDSCTETFSTTFDLKKHKELKHTSKTIKDYYRCHICEEKFRKLPLVREHLNVKHKNKGFFCSNCRAVLKGDARQHMSSKHSRAFDCDICGAKFSSKTQLKVHQRKHSGERPYECKVCGDRFAHSTVLKLHYRKHTGEKPFPCPLCTKKAIAFTQLAHMKNHMKVIHHQVHPYMCVGCNVFYRTKNQLVIHYEDSLRCKEISKKYEDNEEDNSEIVSLSNLRILLAAVIKKISKPQLLMDLGFNRRLIDNVLKDTLENTKQPYILDEDLSDLDCLRLNTMTFLSWIVPASKMKVLRQRNASPEDILENILDPSKETTKKSESSTSSSPVIIEDKPDLDEIEISDSEDDSESENDNDAAMHQIELSTNEF